MKTKVNSHSHYTTVGSADVELSLDPQEMLHSIFFFFFVTNAR